MELTPLLPEHLPAAAEMFADAYRVQRALVPCAPATFEDPAETARRLEWMVARGQGLAAFEDSRLAGYLAWYVVDGFRHTDRRGAYCPEWAHSARPGAKARVYRALYRAAAQSWTAAGCSVHALTLLADDAEAREIWFWNGFGMLVVDAVRELEPSAGKGVGEAVVEATKNTAPGFMLRQAGPADTPLLAELEAEHWQHYADPPVFMAANGAKGPDEFVSFLSDPANSAWLALKDGQPAAYLRFAPQGDGAVAVLASEQGAHCNGAFTRPAYRGSRLAPALLDLAIRHYAALGRQRMTVVFESINPEAAAFWPRYFTPFCYSMMRIPEKVQLTDRGKEAIEIAATRAQTLLKP